MVIMVGSVMVRWWHFSWESLPTKGVRCQSRQAHNDHPFVAPASSATAVANLIDERLEGGNEQNM